MKALKDCKWGVMVTGHYKGKYCFWANTRDINGLDSDCKEIYGTKAETKKQALADWHKFAELNGITNFKITEL